MFNSNPIKVLLNNEEKNKKMIDINIIKSQTKYEIIELLKDNEMNYEDIVENLSKSKATVSMHLKHLRESGIVKYKADPTDNRKKIFYLSAEVLGGIDTKKIKGVKENQTESLMKEFVHQGNIEYTLMLVHFFKSVLVELGIDIDYIVSLIGNHMGEYLFEILQDENLETFCENIKNYWKVNNLGDLSFDFSNNITVSCVNCFECSSLPKLGKPSCYLEKGMFEKLFSLYFKFDVDVLEIKCYAMGDEKCVFEVQP